MPPAKTPRLSPRQEAFVTAYLSSPGDLAKAYYAAGYKAPGSNSASSGASRLLNVPAVKAEIQRRLKILQEDTDVTISYVVQRYKQVIERCMQAVPMLNSAGEPTGIFEFKPMAAIKALDSLAKYKGMFVDKSEQKITTTVNQTISVEEQNIPLDLVRSLLEQIKQRKQIPTVEVIDHKPIPPVTNP